MGSGEADNLNEGEASESGGWLARGALALLALAALGALYLWSSREQIAGDFIDEYLAKTGLEASYDIVSIGPQRQEIANVVVGDPDAPDLTIDRVLVDVSYGLGAPNVGAVVAERPRLYGTYRDGQLSFGALDPILFGESDSASKGLPALSVTVRDGGARLDTDFGAVGAFFEGSGPLDDGFSGKLALVSSEPGVEGCRAERATAYGDVTTENGAPRFVGPIRLSALECQGVALASANIGTALTAAADFAKVDGGLDFETGALSYGDLTAEALTGSAGLSLSEEALVMDHELTLARFDSPYMGLAAIGVDGVLRSARGFTQNSWDTSLDGEGLSPNPRLNEALESAREASEGTLAASLLTKFEAGLSAGLSGARAQVTMRARGFGEGGGEGVSVVVPEAQVRTDTGEALLAISRLSWSRADAQSGARLSGNILTGGANLPEISARIDQPAGGALSARLSLAPYSADADRIAVPSLTVRQVGSGYAFAGALRASGAIPGGVVRGLEAPISGVIDASGRVRVGRSCEDVRFEGLSAYNLRLDAASLRLCPGDSGAMLAYASDLEIDIASDALDLKGDLAGSPTRLAAGRAAFAYPGGFELAALDAAIGEADNAVRFSSEMVSGRLGEAIKGEFAGASAALDVVPLDISQLSGNWSYADSALTIDQADFTLTERPAPDAGPDEDPRFNPLRSRAATLTLKDSVIAARAALEHKASGKPITQVAITHDLSSSQGSARISVPGVQFDRSFSVQDLTPLTKGVIAFTEGVVTGEGRVAWIGEDITSSGVFRTDDLDLAAAFGPVEGIKGEIRFSDLINLTTEPDQVVEIASVNPGIEAREGKVRFALKEGTIVDVKEGRWPFMGGELIMRPTTLEYGTSKDQRYIFEVIALDAATFVSQMELSNLSAEGTFDGTLQIVFDKDGYGRIEEGLLISRAPGGNVSYIGELTYEDMGAISNYAFQSLRSLDFRQMSVALGGDLAGEIITKFRIDGVRQGKDASRNFITRRLAKLPIRFNINVCSENFFEIATMVRRFSDPSAIPDPVDQGLISADALRAVAPETPDPNPNTNPNTSDAIKPDEPRVQPPESETVP